MWADSGKIKEWFSGGKKCSFCDAKLGPNPFKAEVVTAEGVWNAEVCEGCTKLLDVIQNRVKELDDDDQPV